MKKQIIKDIIEFEETINVDGRPKVITSYGKIKDVKYLNDDKSLDIFEKIEVEQVFELQKYFNGDKDYLCKIRSFTNGTLPSEIKLFIPK